MCYEIRDSFSVLPVSEPKRVKRYWFKDGNIVLLDGDRAHAYRVHASLLSQKSKVFGDLLNIPQPQSQDSIDSCPVVPLSDSHKEIDTLLGLIYYGWKCVVDY